MNDGGNFSHRNVVENGLVHLIGTFDLAMRVPQLGRIQLKDLRGLPEQDMQSLDKSLLVGGHFCRMFTRVCVKCTPRVHHQYLLVITCQFHFLEIIGTIWFECRKFCSALSAFLRVSEISGIDRWSLFITLTIKSTSKDSI